MDGRLFRPGAGLRLYEGIGMAVRREDRARYSGASFVGININADQIEHAKLHTRDVGSLCRFIHGDFMRIPEDDDCYDAAFAIESTVHAPDEAVVFSEILRVVRPGACFAAYGWCLTENFDPGNAEHQRIKKNIMTGDGLPKIALTSEVCVALRTAGFELLEARDRAPESDPQTPWYRPLQGGCDLTLPSALRIPFVHSLVNLTLRAGERLRLFPEDLRAANRILMAGADALVEGGKSDIFTSMFYFLSRKPPRSGG